MSAEKPAASGQQPPAAKHAVPQTTPLFRAMNFELFVKPVRSYTCHLSIPLTFLIYLKFKS